MVSFSISFLLGLLATGLVQGAAIYGSTANPSTIFQRREEVGDNDIESVPQAVRDGPVGKLTK